MRVLQLTPGTGHFYCGSCLRDAALVQALRARGHDALIAPLYLPFALEQGEEVPGGRVHLGGINMYLQHKLPALARVPRFLHDWLDRPGLLRWAARKGTMTEPADLGALTVSTLRGEAGRQHAEIDRLAEFLEGQPKPDVILLSNVMLAGLVRSIKEATESPLVCTLQGEVPFLDGMVEPWRTRAWDELRERARDVDGFIAVSAWYGGQVRERLGLPVEKVHAVHNGIDLADWPAQPATAPSTPTIGYLARMCADKGLPTLIDAFMLVRERVPGARLRVCGVMLSEDRALVRAQKDKLAAAGLTEAVDWLPNVERSAKVEFLRTLSVLSVPATYGESFGLYLLEAWASGVPVVQPRHGAFPEVLECGGGGVLCDPDDPRALAEGLTGLLEDPERAHALGEAGRRSVAERFSLERMAAGVEEALRRAAGIPAPGQPVSCEG